MFENATSLEYVRVALALGVMLIVVIHDRWRVPGGAVATAGFLGLFANRPVFAVTTTALSLLTYFIVSHVLARRILLYGRRRLFVLVIVGMVLNVVAGLLAVDAEPNIAWLGGLGGIGFLMPGLIAQDIERHGIRLKVLTILGSPLLTVSINSGSTGSDDGRTSVSAAYRNRQTRNSASVRRPPTKLRPAIRRQQQRTAPRPGRFRHSPEYRGESIVRVETIISSLLGRSQNTRVYAGLPDVETRRQSQFPGLGLVRDLFRR